MNINEEVTKWCESLQLEFEPTYLGGGSEAIQLNLNDGRFILIQSTDTDKIPTNLNEPIIAELRNDENNMCIDFYVEGLKEFHIRQAF